MEPMVVRTVTRQLMELNSSYLRLGSRKESIRLLKQRTVSPLPEIKKAPVGLRELVSSEHYNVTKQTVLLLFIISKGFNRCCRSIIPRYH